MSSKPPLLLVHPGLNPPGGGNAVGAWALSALVGQYDVTLLAWRPHDLSRVNSYFGTDLRPDQFRVRFFPRLIARTIDRSPSSFAMLESQLLHRYARRLRRQLGKQVLALSTHNEADLGPPAIQYVHYPAAAMPRPTQDLRPIHRVPGLVTVYRAASQVLGGSSLERIRANRTLTNSAYIGDLVRNTHGIDSQVLFPPVPGQFPQVPWGARDEAVVCIGRFSGEKRQLEAVEIVSGVRAAGFDLKLHLVGSVDDPVYAEKLFSAQRRYPDWLQIHSDLPRDRMLEFVARQRYGLHTMEKEHFGIAVAELQRCGCLTLAHDSGGPREILGGDSRLLFKDNEDAVNKLIDVLSRPALKEQLRGSSGERAGRFTAERFCMELRRHVAEMV